MVFQGEGPRRRFCGRAGRARTPVTSYEGWRREVPPEDLPGMCRSEGHSTGPPVPQDGGAWADQWLLGRWVAPGPPTRGLQSPVLCAHLRLPSGLEDVSKYPDLVAELLRRQWTEAEVRGALAANLLRVFEAVEQVRGPLRSSPRPPSLPPRRQAAQPVSVPRRAITHKVLRRSPSRWASWRLPAGQSTATPRPPASTSSRGPCWPPSLPSSSACVFCDTLGSKTPRAPGAWGRLWPSEQPRLQEHCPALHKRWPILSRHLGSPGQHAVGGQPQAQ